MGMRRIGLEVKFSVIAHVQITFPVLVFRRGPERAFDVRGKEGCHIESLYCFLSPSGREKLKK